MARENDSEEWNSAGVTAERHYGIDITCPHCDSRWTCGDPMDSMNPTDPTCPDCETSFSVRVREEFALVERGGWTVAVSVAAPDRQGVLGDG